MINLGVKESYEEIFCMKKFYNLVVFYTVIAIVGSVFYREFTKFNGFNGTSTLSFVHTHAFMSGMFFFLILINSYIFIMLDYF